MADNNPLLKALPPEIDYISYLTILEYNLTLAQLPILHNILQDTTLTSNIGWDLVHLLLPLLPESQTCLQDVARLGNPREVVLKVSELLEELTSLDDSEDDDNEAHRTSEEPEQTTPSHQDDGSVSQKQGDLGKPRKPPSKVLRFRTLVDMLAILHPRIKTKHPSRFLSTSLQALLSTYATLLTDDGATEAVLIFIKTFASSKRPRLPPRQSSTQVPTQPQDAPTSAPDPEANKEPIAPEEHALQKRLLQSFLTFVAEGYISSLPPDDDTAAMSWSSRLQEKLNPERDIPGRVTRCEAFEQDENFHHRDAIAGQILALARDLNLSPDDLVKSLVETEDPATEDSEDLPSSASDVPLSRPGCLHLLCATIASTVLFHAPSTVPSLSIFPTFSSILGSLLSDPSSGNTGTEPISLIDSLLYLGSYLFETHGIAHPPDDDTIFITTLQRLSLLSANTPSAPLRYNAHVLTSNLLHAHPNPHLRFSIVTDTLQHCPYENLKASAVGWLKDEILTANNMPASASASTEQGGTNPFATSAGVTSISPQIFPSVSNMSDKEFLAHQPFFMAVLNFFYFLLVNASLRDRFASEVVRKGAEEWLEEMRVCVEKRRRQDEGEEGMVLLEGLVGMCMEKLEHSNN
ncbi:MAG: hypothetical protein Q9170_004851 [Blastenia crenularia]